MPSLQQLRYLVAVADTLHFSRAAEMTHVTQPTLSMQIRELEQRLGAILIERSRAKVMLTPIGTEVVRRARTILAGVQDIREIAASGDATTLQGILRMGVVHSIGAYLLSVVMPDLRKTFPALRLYVREDHLALLPRQLQDGVHDLLILPQAPVQPGIVSTPLIREPLMLVLPAGHRLAQRDRIDPADLAGETVLTMERGHHIQAQIASLCEMTGAHLARDYEGTTLDTLRQMVASGMGISLLPALYVRSEVLRERLVVARPLSDQIPERDIYMAWRANAAQSVHYDDLAQLMRDALAPFGAVGVPS